MNKKANQFQNALEQLEAGENPETVQEAMPAEVRGTLSLITRMHTITRPERDPQNIRTQRQNIIRFYKQEQPMDKQEQPKFNLFKDWRLPVAISAVVAVLFVCGLIAIVGVGSAVWFGSQWANETSPSEIELVNQPKSIEAHKVSAGLLESLQPNEAVLTDLQGLVEVQVDESWQPVTEETILSTITRLRTSSFSSAILAFKDGSLAQIGPDSEISIETLAVDPKNGTREIRLMQWAGESSHDVTPLELATNIYQVDTPSALAQVKGTQFHVRVVPEETMWYVDAGAVDVSGGGSTVQVAAGEMTSVTLDEEPADPVEFITGQGEVTYIGESWEIGDQTYQTHAQTLVIGNPQVGDLVFYEGHLLEDETRVADLIVLVRRNPANTFTLTGEVQEMGDLTWTVNGQSITVTDTTEVEDGIAVGDLVRVKGIILGDGSLEAEEIRLVLGEVGTPFEFTGVVQEIGELSWRISDITVAISETTTIDEGLVVGDAVKVQGWTLEDGTRLATSITYFLDQDSAFEFFGILESMDPWMVAGIPFEVREWTTIDEGLNLGDLVRVAGEIQTDGTWVASEVQRYDEALLTVLIGRVSSMEPWVVSGFELNVDAETIIEGEITVGMLVRVELQLLPDGTHKVIRISPLEGFDWELSCQSLVVTVTSIEGDQIILEGGAVLSLSDDIQLVGEIQPGSVIQTMICYDEDMNVIVVYIVVLEEPVLPPPESGDGEKVTVCHKPNSKNPHEITISSSALNAHLAHGDTLGPCP